MKKVFGFLALGLVGILGLSACSGDNETSKTVSIPTTEVPTTEVPTTEVPTTEVPTTEVPTTEVPTTEVPTIVPTTEVPTTVPTTGPVVLEDTTVYVVGDSTVCSFNDSYYLPRYGYGTQIGNYLDDSATIVNYALSGRSSKSFLEETNYNLLKQNLKEGDYLVVGFGHNDEKSDDSERFTDASKPLTDESSFKYSLNEYYVELAKEKGATPILCTPIVRANKNNDYSGSSAHITTTGDYAEAIIELGEEVDVDVIDLTGITKAKYTELGYQEAQWYHAFTTGKLDTDGTTVIANESSIDTTHINIYGAKFVAYSFADALLDTDCSLKNYVLDDIKEPTKANDLVPNPNYVVSPYTAPNLSSFGSASHFATITSGWYGTAFGDCGGDPSSASNGYVAQETSAGVFSVGSSTEKAKGKITSTEGIAFLFKQVGKNDNFTLTADAKVVSQANKGQAGFGIMLRDDCYLPVKDSSILSNYVAAGMYTSSTNCNIIYKRENATLSAGASSVTGLYKDNDTASLKIQRVGQVVTCTVVYKDNTYTDTFTDFDFVAIDNEYMYVGMYATRGTVVEFTNVVYTYTGESQGA